MILMFTTTEVTRMHPWVEFGWFDYGEARWTSATSFYDAYRIMVYCPLLERYVFKVSCLCCRHGWRGECAHG
jgi:hypothetical protein